MCESTDWSHLYLELESYPETVVKVATVNEVFYSVADLPVDLDASNREMYQPPTEKEIEEWFNSLTRVAIEDIFSESTPGCLDNQSSQDDLDDGFVPIT